MIFNLKHASSTMLIKLIINVMTEEERSPDGADVRHYFKILQNFALSFHLWAK